MNKHLYIITVITSVIAVLGIIFAINKSNIVINTQNVNSHCESHYKSSSDTIQRAKTDKDLNLILDENGEMIIETISTTHATLAISCDCDISYNGKNIKKHFNMSNTYNHELSEEEKDCTQPCNQLCQQELSKLKA